MVQQDNYLSRHDNVQDWLMDVPGYQDNRLSVQVESSKTRRRPCSIASISSEDSISLDELINANFTTDMTDETDLPELAALELDDSKEEFWKVDNYSNHFILTQFSGKKEPSYYGSNRSKHDVSLSHLNIAVNEYEFMSKLNLTSDTPHHDYTIGATKPFRLQPPKLPMSYSRWDRSSSFSSEASMNSQSTTPLTRSSRQQINPSASTSTSSSSTTNSSATSRSSIYKAPSDQKPVAPARRKSSLAPFESLHETRISSRTTVSQLAKRASSASLPNTLSTTPSSNNNKPTSTPPVPQRTKSTIITNKSVNPQHGSISRLNQLSRRASHIPAPSTRSGSSLGMTSIFASQSKQIRSRELPRPQTSLDSLKASASTVRLSRTSSLVGAPTPSRSTTGLKRFGPR
ncbi:hypothetical protein BD560DRAFT_394854 [Blakeslea trispora]|nr:hypothetical protein BD560DRAFT_394854 [Blakeslea trispora]